MPIDPLKEYNSMENWYLRPGRGMEVATGESYLLGSSNDSTIPVDASKVHDSGSVV